MDGILLARPEQVGDGIALAVKDLFDTAELTTTYGSAVFAEHVPATTAVAVAQLEAAGYVDIGKTNLHEFAYGTTSENPHYGTVPNPVAPGRIAGGSSGGSAAALAAGLADAALGTDSGGSIRIPSACCGTVGFKPTYGLVSLAGCFPLAPTYDHAGPMARTVEDCEAMMRVLAPGFEPTELESLDELRVGFAWIDEADPLVAEQVRRTAAHFPDRRPVELRYPTETNEQFMHEVADVHRELYAEHGDLYGEDVGAKIERCLAVSDAAAATSAKGRESYREEAHEQLAGFDLLVTPTLMRVAPPTGIGDLELRNSLVRCTYPFNTLGWPALALPCGAAEDGLPASVQLVGRPGDDARVLAAGKLLASLVRGTAQA